MSDEGRNQRRIAGLSILARMVLSLLVLPVVAVAAPPATMHALSVEQAQKAVSAAVSACSEDGYRVSAAIVNRHGILKAFARADGAGPHTVDSSRHKAYTAASLGESTARLARLIAGKPELQALRDMNASILILAGGLPIRRGGEILGGIGVGGAPGGDLDERCAQAGLRAIDAGAADDKP